MDIRKTVTLVEEINSEYGARADSPLRRVAIAAVFKNPLAGEAAGVAMDKRPEKQRPQRASMLPQKLNNSA
jgi:Amino acid synthesis